MKFTSLDEIKIYQQSLLLSKDIYNLCKNPKLSKEFSLQDQIKRSSISVAANIAEGYGRNTKKDFANFLSIALGSANETIAFLDFLQLSFTLNTQKLIQDYQVLCKQIYSFRRYLQTYNQS